MAVQSAYQVPSFSGSSDSTRDSGLCSISKSLANAFVKIERKYYNRRRQQRCVCQSKCLRTPMTQSFCVSASCTKVFSYMLKNAYIAQYCSVANANACVSNQLIYCVVAHCAYLICFSFFLTLADDAGSVFHQLKFRSPNTRNCAHLRYS